MKDDIMPATFTYNTLDQVAETYDGVSDESYRVLWSLVRDDYELEANIYEMGPCEYRSTPDVNGMTAHWSDLPESVKGNLREVAVARRADDKLAKSEYLDAESVTVAMRFWGLTAREYYSTRIHHACKGTSKAMNIHAVY